ncbi:MAG: tRNA 2-thiouridine(34) synthase MnmA [Alphaproteobacteria bacterium]|nr:tRNA 2-thiouridine(34) synthase MnmA [Alphaproteobacteria bacterium]
MSGGVDSSTVAALLVEQGHDVIGVHMKLHDAAPGSAPGTCCGLDDALDARRVAEHLGIPFYVSNLRQAFEEGVMAPFADAYVAGRTPNPCVLCNGVLKFRVLLGRALAFGADHLATGHYGIVDHGSDGPALRMATDRGKDQSYFLFSMTPAALSRTWFPLGALHKDEVRAHAARLGLLTADKPESQDVCFLPHGDHAGFVAARHPDLRADGDIVDEQGRVVGHHDGYHRFTVGQRRGLAVALGYPAFVVRIEPETRRVVVASAERLDHHGLMADGCTWLADPAQARAISVRVRHRGPVVPCSVRVDDDRVHATFHTPLRAVAPGQAAVFYDGDRVLGGGWIRHAVEA